LRSVRSGEGPTHYKDKHRSIAARGIAGQREPARRQQKVSTFLADRGQAHSLHRAVLFVRQRTSVVKRERDVLPNAGGLRQGHAHGKRGRVIALEAYWLPVASEHPIDLKVRVQFHLDCPRSIESLKLHLGPRGELLLGWNKRRADVVMHRAESEFARRLRPGCAISQQEQSGECRIWGLLHLQSRIILSAPFSAPL